MLFGGNILQPHGDLQNIYPTLTERYGRRSFQSMLLDQQYEIPSNRTIATIHWPLNSSETDSKRRWPVTHIRTSKTFNHHAPAHPCIAIFELVHSFDHRVMPWKFRDNITDRVTEKHTNRCYWKQYHPRRAGCTCIETLCQPRRQ